MDGQDVFVYKIKAQKFIKKASSICIRIVQFGVQSKVWVRKLSRILMNPRIDVRELLKICQTLSQAHQSCLVKQTCTLSTFM
jgi:hypothetical protein